MTLATFQQSFWDDLWSATGNAEGPWARQPGFAVYRNTVRQACVDALLSLYPAVLRLTGPDWLHGVALDYVETHPPEDGRLQLYGGGFADHLARVLPPDELPWLPAVARLDRCWAECHVAADAPVLAADRLLAGPVDTVAARPLAVHPATRWLGDPDWPVFSLWRAARDGLADPNPPHWRGEWAVFTRPDGAVQAVEAGAGAPALLDACAAGLPLSEALAGVADPGPTLARLLAQGAFTETLP